MLCNADFQGWSLTLETQRLWDTEATLRQQEDTVGNRDPHFTPSVLETQSGESKRETAGGPIWRETGIYIPNTFPFPLEFLTG